MNIPDLIQILLTENTSKWNVECENEYKNNNLKEYEKYYINIKLKINKEYAIEYAIYHDKYMFEECWYKWFNTIEDYYKVYPFRY